LSRALKAIKKTNMKYVFKIVILISILISCKYSKSGTNHTDSKNNNSVSYEEGLNNCIKIKEENPDNYFLLLNNCMVGSEIPEFKATSIDGKIIGKKELKGKVSIINFWLTTCPPCIAEIPRSFRLCLNIT